MKIKALIISAVLLLPVAMSAQVGEYRNDLAVGVNGGYTLSKVGFTPSIPQNMLGGFTGGVTVRYNCEKYFKSICALVGELNIVQTGWKENILDANNQAVINSVTGAAETYERHLTYVQLPLMARMGWGRERSGLQGFFQVGPQFGYNIGDTHKSNFEWSQRNVTSRVGAQQDAVQDTLSIQNKFDYGIVGGAGLEYSNPKIGHFILEGRYYYGLGDMFSNSKRDYFGRSNLGVIQIKLTYLWDIRRTKNDKIK
jgi:hypothetical protein